MKSKKMRGGTLTAAQVRKLLAAQRVPPRRDEEAARRFGEAFQLDDGTFLVWFKPGGGALYPSHEDYLAVMREAEERASRGPYDPVADLLPPAASLVADAARLGAGLAVTIGCTAELDGSVASMEEVERAVAALPTRRRLSAEVVTALVAYVGEVIRREVNGRWEVMQTGNGGETGEPIVREPDGTIHQPFGVVYKELIRGRKGSMHGALIGELAARTLGGPPRTNGRGGR